MIERHPFIASAVYSTRCAQCFALRSHEVHQTKVAPPTITFTPSDLNFLRAIELMPFELTVKSTGAPPHHEL